MLLNLFSPKGQISGKGQTMGWIQNRVGKWGHIIQPPELPQVLKFGSTGIVAEFIAVKAMKINTRWDLWEDPQAG